MLPVTVRTKVHLGFINKLVNDFYYILKRHCAKDNMGTKRGVLHAHKRLVIDRSSDNAV